jgi:hypothetical protein
MSVPTDYIDTQASAPTVLEFSDILCVGGIGGVVVVEIDEYELPKRFLRR